MVELNLPSLNHRTSAPVLVLSPYLYALVVLACLGTVPVIFYQGQGVNSLLLTAADWAIWAIFVIEYGALLILAPNRRRYARGNWLSAGIIVLSFPQLPAVMGFIRLVRLTRILRLFLVAAKGLRHDEACREPKELCLCGGRDGIPGDGGCSTAPYV